ncbi:two-component system, chemotaxis family, response regulator CheV [Pseudobutyrivibrio sp. YE44]|uniref:chemotaxis protein n=1 Tax=Pseudobutyrivibrio sp. YE44 TaxID=1520802 RepID=UPI00088DCD16|nr:chemotaxis protein [Pseudobutyrivibrio sp. YE44]SDB08425.1 two-component system, chemotaxis family, response regulator CheV [Pseudobutyrivibrio sp. YE44]
MDTNILLESGTNELEVLEFKVGKNFYGINVAKIREILLYQPVTPLPNAHPCIEGIFMPRDIMISVISLRKCLNITDEANNDGLFIITNFNSLNTAFHVDEVLGIHRVSWEDIIKPDATISSDESGVSTGVIKLEDRLVVILDFEKIVTDINPETGLKVSEMDDYETRDRSKSPILLCEDSPLLSKLIVECLKKAGYTNLLINMNGQEGWDKLVELHKNGTVLNDVHLIITDIEMPLMDGHRLCKLVKENDTMKNIPLIIFSSLINDEIRRKGESLGADAQLTKPEIGKLISVVDELVAKYEDARKGN